MNPSVGGHLGQLASPTHGQCLAPMGCVLDLTQVVRWLLPWPTRWARREQGGEGRSSVWLRAARHRAFNSETKLRGGSVTPSHSYWP